MPLEQRRYLADHVKARVDRGDDVIHVIYEPGDSTHYEFVLTRLGVPPITMVVGGRSTYRTHEPDRWLLSDAEKSRAMLVDLSPGSFTHPSYVLEKWRTTIGSACAVAELLSMVAGVDDELLDSMRQSFPPVFGVVPA